MRTVILAAVVFAGAQAPVLAQSNPKREACLREAQINGLYFTGGRNDMKSNGAVAPQRAAFMKACMARR